MKILLKNANSFGQTSKLERCDILIEGNKVKTIKPYISCEVDRVIDCEEQLLLPGFIDIHVHLREPGGEEKETIKTGTMAAARGGFTTVCAMPNTNPVPDSIEKLQHLQEMLKNEAIVRVLPYAAISKELAGEQLTKIPALAKEGAFAFTDDGVGIQTAGMMYEAMKQAAQVKMPIVAHCEDNSLLYGGVIHDGEVNRRLKLPGIRAISESVQIARDVLLAEATGCHYHVCHVSTKESVRIIRDAKRAGIHVTAEVTPHHLLLNENDIMGDNANYKMNPPLRSEADQQALLDGLLDGTIDFIATDHAPHTEREKAEGFYDAPFGIVGLETAFSLLYTYLVKTELVTLHQLVDWLTKKPAEVFRLPYGKLEENGVADLTLINLANASKIDKYTFLSKGRNTPFHQYEVFGEVEWTMVDGKIVYKKDCYTKK
ncbi:dihydroorotase [Virgibacillus soli]|uniref:dihydroorotase n=1 Tax=Paracerasibacillus soli TaxID=480284 RepID=UPI0035E9ED0B